MMDFKGKAKWDAWNKLKGLWLSGAVFPRLIVSLCATIGLSADEAMQKYVDFVNKLAAQ
jgi:acyl-CoA-binding protein